MGSISGEYNSENIIFFKTSYFLSPDISSNSKEPLVPQLWSYSNFSMYSDFYTELEVINFSQSNFIGRESIDGFVYQVKFKYSSKYYLLGSMIIDEDSEFSPKRLIRNGDFVLVEADRGLDIGKVVAKAPMDGFKENRLSSGTIGDYKLILRVANDNEIYELSRKNAEEAQAVEVQRNI